MFDNDGVVMISPYNRDIGNLDNKQTHIHAHKHTCVHTHARTPTPTYPLTDTPVVELVKTFRVISLKQKMFKFS